MATVLLIPGFGGSELRHRWPTWSGYRTAWLDPAILIASGLEILALDASGQAPRLPFFPTLSAGTAIALYYPLLIDYLRARGWEVDVARSDWRRPLAFSATTVADQVQALATAGPVRVVAHSRGGLLAVEAVRVLASRGALGALRQVVTLCSPHRGTYAAVPWLGGWPFRVPAVALLLTAPGSLGALPLIARQVRSVFATFWGAYELLPEPVAAAAAGDATAGRLYEAGPWIASGVPTPDGPRDAARARWAAWTPPTDTVRIDCVVGVGGAALSGPCDFSTLGTPAGVPGLTSGDGVVPSWSAGLAGRTRIELPVSHQGVLSDPAALAVLDGLLRS